MDTGVTSSGGITVLVLDADMVPALTVARSLARRGATVHVGTHEPKPLAGYSRAVDVTWSYPNPLSDQEGFLRWVAAHTASHRYDLVIPVTERTLVPLSRERDRFLEVPIAMPDAESLDVVLDKSRTMALASSLDIPVPGGTLVSSADELEPLIQSIRYPVVLKPARSIGANQAGASQLQVSYAFDESELRAGCAHALRFGQVILQEYFSGDGVGIELIAANGVIAYAFQHRRLHEVPLTGGGSSLRKSEAVDPALLEASRKLIEALRWSGVAMVEFKQCATSGDFCLMEINGRFWGSLPLADAAGADFPSMLFDLSLDGEVSGHPAYREDVVCRLLSRDVGWYEAVLRRDADPRLVQFPTNRQMLREILLFFSPRHRLDVQKLADPLPGVVDLGRILATQVRRVTGLVGEKRFLARQRKRWRDGTVERCVVNAQRMLFLCYGNINRSALADALVRGYAEDSGIAVQSAGFHEESGRSADPIMVDVAAACGGDLRDSRSECVTAEDLAKADVIFVMEQRHLQRVVEMNPAAEKKTFLLGAHASDHRWPAAIDDPYGGTRAAYEHCHTRITAAIDSLKSFIAMRPAP